MTRFLLSSDSFTRSGGLGSTNGPGILDSQAWSVTAGTCATNGTQAHATVAAAHALLDLGTGDIDISLTYGVLDANGWGIIFRYTDENNYLHLDVAQNQTPAIYKLESGSSSSIVSTTATANAGSVYRITAFGTALAVYQDGVLKGSGTSSFNQTAALAGMNFQGTSQRSDNFAAYTNSSSDAVGLLILGDPTTGALNGLRQLVF